MSKRKFLFIILLTAFFLRLAFIIFYSDLKSYNYWEYGELAKNLVNGKGYSLFYPENGKIGYHYKPDAKPHPSAYMPPLYPIIITPFIIQKDITVGKFLIFLFQTLLSLLNIYLIYHLAKESFSEWVGRFSAIIYAIFPEFIYASGTVGTTIIYHTGIIFILLFLIKYDKIQSHNKSNINLIIASIVLGIMVLLRSEVVFFIIVIVLYYLVKKRTKKSLIVIIVSVVIILPWQIRNYLEFKEIVPLTTSGGLNFYRGHNPYGAGIWADNEIDSLLKKHIHDSNYEIKANSMYISKAVESINKNPAGEINLTFTKLYHLFIVNPNDKRSGNIIYLLFWFLLLGLSIYGLIILWKNPMIIYYKLFFISTVATSIIFFVLPRYQTMSKVLLIPFAAYAMIEIIDKIEFFTKKSKS